MLDFKGRWVGVERFEVERYSLDNRLPGQAIGNFYQEHLGLPTSTPNDQAYSASTNLDMTKR
jgi:hypothetical protein